MLLGGKLPENNNTYEKQKKHFDEFTLARRKEKKKPSHFLEVFSCLKYLRTSRNKSEQVHLVCSFSN